MKVNWYKYYKICQQQLFFPWYDPNDSQNLPEKTPALETIVNQYSNNLPSVLTQYNIPYQQLKTSDIDLYKINYQGQWWIYDKINKDLYSIQNLDLQNYFDDDLYDAVSSGISIPQVLDFFNIEYDFVKLGNGIYYVIREKPEIKIISNDGSIDDVDDFMQNVAFRWTEFLSEQDDFNKMFWEVQSEFSDKLYHSTKEENWKNIQESGYLEPKNITRGIENRSTGSGIFTSTEPYETESYGDVLLEINVQQMANDGYKPQVDIEEPVLEAKIMERIAHAIGYDNYDSQYEEGISPNTVIFFEKIPIKYITRVKESLSFKRLKYANFKEYPIISGTSDGRTIRQEIPNMESIDATLDEYRILPGIRDVPLSEFYLTGKHYSYDGTQRIRELAKEIQQSGEINPLIVVIEKEGPYILEGATRAEALYLLGANSFPALVVEENDQSTLSAD